MANALDYIQASNRQSLALLAYDPDYQDFLDAAATLPAQRVSDYAMYEAYYDGEHNARLTDRAKEYLERSGVTFSENFCEPVIDVLSERLTVTGFSTEVEKIDEWLADVWERNRMDATQGTVHTTAILKGDGYVIVDWNEEQGRPIFAQNRPEIVQCKYSDDGETTLWAAKAWDTTATGPMNEAGRAICRLNVYWPDRVEKWFRLQAGGKGGWQHWLEEAGSDDSWMVDWTDADDKPLGVPVFHFRNRPIGRTAGRSELRSVIPQQDLLNKLVLDMAMILDNQGWRQRWVAGVDPTNTSFKNIPGDVWMSADKDVTFGDFQTDDAEGILAAIEGALSRIARRSRTPLHLLTGGDMPSGEALRTAESGVVAKAQDRMTSFGNAWEDVMRMGMKLAQVNGALPVDVDVADIIIKTQWDDPLSRNEKEEVETAILLRELGVSQWTLLTGLGHDPEAEEKKRAEEKNTATDALERFMDRGAGQGGREMPMEDEGEMMS